MSSLLQRSNTTRPIKQFVYIDLPQTVDAFNELINDINTQIIIINNTISTGVFPIFTVALLPVGGGITGFAFASNGRKVGEGAASGTGVPVYYDTSSSQWLVFSTDAPVLS